MEQCIKHHNIIYRALSATVTGDKKVNYEENDGCESSISILPPITPWNEPHARKCRPVFVYFFPAVLQACLTKKYPLHSQSILSQ